MRLTDSRARDAGLTDSEMEQLAHHSAEHPVAKASRRDIAPIVARKGNGATTVSATMLIAHLVGIGVFVTGGIGGVHRGAEHCTMPPTPPRRDTRILARSDHACCLTRAHSNGHLG